MTAKQLLAVEIAVVGGAVLALLAKEVPGLVREVRIWRMIDYRAGSRHPRTAR
jgi:hypothetical protein